MKKKMFISLFLIIVFVGTGCATGPKSVWKSEPNVSQAENEYFYAAISPIFIFDGYKGFVLTIHNKTSKSLELDWSKVFYIYNGEMNGGFIFLGMRAGDRDKAKPPEIISGDRLFQKEIFPGNLAQISKLAGATVYRPMKPGENGIHLTVKVGQKEMTEKLTLNFTEQ